MCANEIWNRRNSTRRMWLWLLKGIPGNGNGDCIMIVWVGSLDLFDTLGNYDALFGVDGHGNLGMAAKVFGSLVA